jgi:Tol biopolymer transport system component
MKNRLLGLSLLGLILFLSGGILYTWGTPRLLEVAPAAGAVDVPASAPLLLKFSRPMQPDSVSQHLVIQPAVSGKVSGQGSTITFTPDQPWPSGTDIQARMESGAYASGILGLSLRSGKTWSFTTGRPQIVYLYPSDGPAQLYSIDPETLENRQLSDISGEVIDFSVSAGGSEIYFDSSQGDAGSIIYRWDRKTGQSSPILRCPRALCRYSQASPSGDYLAFERTSLIGEEQARTPEVWLMALPKGNPQNPAPAPQPHLVGDKTHQTNQPSWSPDGLLTYYDTDLASFILFNPKNGETSKFSSQTGLPGSWGPDGNSYVISQAFDNPISNSNVISNVQVIPSSHLWLFNRKDASLKDLTGSDTFDDTSPALSPKGDLLAFARTDLNLARWTPGAQIWLMHPDGSQAHQLSEEPTYSHYDFAWSPDGGQLAYTRSDQNQMTEPPELWIVNVDGSLPRQIMIGGYAPQWIP